MKLQKFMSQIYKLRFINRYTNRVRVRDEDVAQHCFFVSAIVLKLHEIYDFDLKGALVAALSHDITEADLSDVTHDVKMKNPDLANEISKAEKREIGKYPIQVHVGFRIFDQSETVEGKVANLADVLQVQQYVLMEISLGNTTMNDIDNEARQRLSKLRRELKDYERNPGSLI